MAKADTFFKYEKVNKVNEVKESMYFFHFLSINVCNCEKVKRVTKYAPGGSRRHAFPLSACTAFP